MASQQQQHQREREMMINKHGKAQTKVAGDDEMLRTGFHNGTPLEAGKIADDPQPIDLFEPAHRLASGQQQQQEEDDTQRYAPAAADHHPASPSSQQQGRQGMAEHAAGGRRLGRQA